eukprot:Plantae.Rhodophyta-Rhodochaete_pulchella.ctg21402.p1 GENE.Plantae.Rhodophyta-Rhodochaete_pulchella.ctg21402~~Plantae.Rhodophyta-Rhodochaete_pulchella.ctg21402.p1  ORF type:complete len:244 (-),score=31.55 Plantae.Rhodophyta-Rhodochaete_pulchella.ctg21402:50-781(-)
MNPAAILRILQVVLLSLIAAAHAQPSSGHGREGENITNRGFKLDFHEIFPQVLSDQGYVQLATAEYHYSLHAADMFVAHGVLAPGALHKIHYHPHANEVLVVFYGIVRACVELEEPGLICKDLGPGQAMVFPRGQIHYEQNPGRTIASAISVLDDEDPGIMILPDDLMEFPSEALSAAFGRPIDTINGIRERVPDDNPARFGPKARPAMSLEEAYERSGFDVPGEKARTNATSTASPSRVPIP